jgi:hypothetical protein
LFFLGFASKERSRSRKVGNSGSNSDIVQITAVSEEIDEGQHNPVDATSYEMR